MNKLFRDRSTCALLFILSVFTHAAPPPKSQSAGQLNLVNEHVITVPHNITLHHNGTHLSSASPFTPGSEPTEDPIYYSVPHSYPPVTIKFRDYHLDPRRNELAVSTALQRAKVECGDIEEQSVEMDELFYKWENGEVILTIEPHQESSSHNQVLTYGLFMTALRGVNNFRLFYPHLDFWYEIFVYPHGEEGATYYLGFGMLSGSE